MHKPTVDDHTSLSGIPLWRVLRYYSTGDWLAGVTIVGMLLSGAFWAGSYRQGEQRDIAELTAGSFAPRKEPALPTPDESDAETRVVEWFGYQAGGSTGDADVTIEKVRIRFFPLGADTEQIKGTSEAHSIDERGDNITMTWSLVGYRTATHMVLSFLQVGSSPAGIGTMVLVEAADGDYVGYCVADGGDSSLVRAGYLLTKQQITKQEAMELYGRLSDSWESMPPVFSPEG